MSPNDSYIYEVIRIIDGKPLFMREHYDRLARTLEMEGKPGAFSWEDFAKAVGQFVQEQSIANDNVKFMLSFDENGMHSQFEQAYHVYPSEEEYMNGVDTQLLTAMRVNPHAKVHDHALRELSNRMIEEGHVFEVILVDKDGYITEGSRSNIFFIKGGIVYTSPAAGVLLGITRQEIIKVCQANDILIAETRISAASIGDYDAAFVSGTSPKVLPIAKIDTVEFDVNDNTLRKVMELFDEHIQHSIQS